MVEKIKSVQPKTGKTHRIFGSRYLKLHNMRDPKWTTKDKFTQYQGLIKIHEKDQRLALLAGAAEMKKRVRQIQKLRQNIKDDREALKLAIYGDPIRKQNLLQNHKGLQRLFQTMPNHMVVENMDQRTFVKRKELDRLLCQRKKLTQKYENELLELSRIQDRIKFANSVLNKDNIIGQKIRMDLKNSETRMKAIKTINKAYQKIINTMMQDSLYFEPVLNALEEDIAEQQSFIDTTIRLGRPALANLDKMSKDYARLVEQTQRDTQPRLETLKEYRNQIERNNEQIKDLVRRDSDFTIFPNRYERQTASMSQMKKNLEEVEKVMKQVKAITSCDKASEVYPRVKRQFRENIRMEGNILPKERERDAANEKDIHAQVQSEALEHSLTPEEIERLKTMESLRFEILEEDRLQSDMTRKIQERNSMLSRLKFSFQHTIDVLRHVGDKHVAERIYDNPDLTLPLLKFTGFVPKARPPSPFEDNVDTVMDLITKRVNILMRLYDEEKFKTERENGIKVFHDAVLQDMHSEEVTAMENAIDPNIVNRLPNEDPTILSRLNLKAISNRIVDANTKKDDFGKKK